MSTLLSWMVQLNISLRWLSVICGLKQDLLVHAAFQVTRVALNSGCSDAQQLVKTIKTRHFLVKYHLTIEINMLTSMNFIGDDCNKTNILIIQLFKSSKLSLFSLKRSKFYSILRNCHVLYRYKIAVRPLSFLWVVQIGLKVDSSN